MSSSSKGRRKVHERVGEVTNRKLWSMGYVQNLIRLGPSMSGHPLKDLGFRKCFLIWIKFTMHVWKSQNKLLNEVQRIQLDTLNEDYILYDSLEGSDEWTK